MWRMGCLISFTIETCHKIYISNDKSETERKNRILTAIISLRKLYSARQYHSQIHLPVAIELTNKTAWRALNMYKVPTVFFFFSLFRRKKTWCWDAERIWIASHVAISPTGQPLCVYGDPAYTLQVHLQAPFRQGVRFTPQIGAYIKSMSEVWVSVEW